MQSLPKKYWPYTFMLTTALLCLLHVASTFNQQLIGTVPYLVYWIKTIAIWGFALLLVVLFPFRFHTRGSSILFFLFIATTKHLALLGLGFTFCYHLAIVDCFNTVLIVVLLMKKGAPICWALLYALNPLITLCLFTDNPHFVILNIAIGLLISASIIVGNLQWGWGVLIVLLAGMFFWGGLNLALLLGVFFCFLFILIYPTCLGLLVVAPLLFGVGPILSAPASIGAPATLIEHALYVLLLLTVILMVIRYCFAIQHRTKKTCETISVVIPTFNEQDRIQACIIAAFESELVEEVLVVDGGSGDATIEAAEQGGAKVLVHKKSFADGGGRGGQIREGIVVASGDVIAVLHADTLVSPSSFMMLINALQKDPLLLGGSLGCSFRSTKKTMKIVEFLNDLRAAVFGISFGDQVQFFRKDLVVSKDIFPSIPLMEDVEFCLRLKRFGYHIHLFNPASCSARRWHKMGGANSVLVIKLFLLYLFKRVFSTPDAVEYYKKYYRK